MTERCDTSGKARPTEDETLENEEDLQRRAEHLYNKGKLGECLMVLEAASAQKKEQDPRQKLVLQMHIAARNREWRKVGAQDIDRAMILEHTFRNAHRSVVPGSATDRRFR